MSYKAYTLYKPSGVEWLGDIPGHWGILPFKRLATIRNGSDYKHIEVEDGEYPVIGSGGAFARSSSYLYNGKSVLLGRKGTIDKPLFIEGPFWVVDTMFYTEIDPRTNAKFVYYSALTIPFDRYSTNTALPSMTQGDLNSHLVTIPNFIEQTAVVNFLDHKTNQIDQLIQKKICFIELLKEKRSALITEAVTGKFDVCTGKPYPKYKDSDVGWLGNVPKHWEIQRITNLYRETNEAGAQHLPVLQISIHYGASDKELDSETSDRKVTRIKDRTKYKRVHFNDLAYNMMRAWQGGFGAITIDGLVSPAYVVATPRKMISSRFIELLLRTPQAIELMRCYSYGITDFRLRLYWDQFKTINIALPPYEKSMEILNILETESKRINLLINKTQQSIDLLKEKRAVLITAAVTGKIDVREAA